MGGGGPDQRVAQALKLKYANRHGLIAGATGTGKTVTLQIMAESFSNAGVPVILSDVIPRQSRPRSGAPFVGRRSPSSPPDGAGSVSGGVSAASTASVAASSGNPSLTSHPRASASTHTNTLASRFPSALCAIAFTRRTSVVVAASPPTLLDVDGDECEDAVRARSRERGSSARATRVVLDGSMSDARGPDRRTAVDGRRRRARRPRLAGIPPRNATLSEPRGAFSRSVRESPARIRDSTATASFDLRFFASHKKDARLTLSSLSAAPTTTARSLPPRRRAASGAGSPARTTSPRTAAGRTPTAAAATARRRRRRMMTRSRGWPTRPTFTPAS